MNSALVAFGVLVSFFLGYRFYSRYLGERVFRLFGDQADDQSDPPSIAFQDNVDFMPTGKSILFGHHYSSIAGAAPILGPAVAVIWGWVPAVLWVVLGTIFMGAVHDFGCLVVSMRSNGQSIGQVASNVLGKRVRTLFMLVIFFLVWLVIAVFALVIASLFVSFPASVIPVNFEIVIALLMGYLINKKGGNLLIPSLLAQAGLLIMIFIGSTYPVSLQPIFGGFALQAWMVFLLIYSYIASTLPVWVLLQPRDYINSHQLFLGLGALLLGLFVTSPEIVAPAFNPNPEGAPSWIPFLFITIACGAISGFHGLVSSGTTSKQIAAWKDARPIGYGGMLGEGLLALLATLAVSAGFESTEAWHAHYGSWQAANGLTTKINAFVIGSGSFLQGIGISKNFSETMIAVLIISFAATSLDTAARIQRYVVTELGANFKIPGAGNRHIAGIIAVGSAGLLMLFQGGGKGGLLLWPLFGATNQMLAALSLIVISVWLKLRKRPSLAFLIPAVFVALITAIGTILNVKSFYLNENYSLTAIALVLLLIQIWVIVEGLLAFRKASRSQ